MKRAYVKLWGSNSQNLNAVHWRSLRLVYMRYMYFVEKPP